MLLSLHDTRNVQQELVNINGCNFFSAWRNLMINLFVQTPVLYKSFSTFHFCKVPVIAVQNYINWRFSWQNILTLETDSWSTWTLSYTILIWFLWTGVWFKAVVIVWMVWVLHNFHCILMKDCFYLLTLKLDDIAHIYIVYSVQGRCF